MSRPVALALDDGLLSRKTTFFDYGCGRGGDLKRLHKMGVSVAGWDPAFFPDEERIAADVVNLGYVVNVIEDLEERAVSLCGAWELAQKLLIVAARLDPVRCARLNEYPTRNRCPEIPSRTQTRFGPRAA